MAELRTVNEIIEALGGVKATAKRTKKTRNAIYQIRSRGKFPAKDERAINSQLQKLNPPVTASLSLFGIDA